MGVRGRREKQLSVTLEGLKVASNAHLFLTVLHPSDGSQGIATHPIKVLQRSVGLDTGY